MTKKSRSFLRLTALAAGSTARIAGAAGGFLMLAVTLLSACTTPAVAPPEASTAAPVTAAPAAAPTPPPALPVIPTPPPPQVAPDPVAPAKATPPVELPEYAKRGKRLPANGNAPGRAVLAYCKGFELEKDSHSYFKRLQRTKRLPTDEEVAERSRIVGQPQTVQQVVERDWALRRDSNHTAPQRCKVLGGSVDGATALVVFEADLNGRRQRGIATVLLNDKNWRVRDHGDWAQVK